VGKCFAFFGNRFGPSQSFPAAAVLQYYPPVFVESSFLAKTLARISSHRADLPFAARIPRRSGRLLIGVFLAATLVEQPVHGEGADSVDELEKASADWVKVRAETAQVGSDWLAQKPFLASIVDGLAERADAADVKHEFLQAKTAKDREDLSALEASSKASSSGLRAADSQLMEMNARLLRLRPSLPPRLSAALELPYKGLAASDITVGDRMQLTMTVLNRCIQFNRVITCDDEVLKVEDSKNPKLMEVIYWGLSHGYALDRSAGNAWLGSPGPEGWHWEPLPESSKQVAQLLAVYHGKSEPRFVEVPAKLKPAPGK
jgi:hypothetical protein